MFFGLRNTSPGFPKMEGGWKMQLPKDFQVPGVSSKRGGCNYIVDLKKAKPSRFNR